MTVYLISLDDYAEINDLDLDEIVKKYGCPKNDVIIAVDFEKFKKTEDDEDEE